MKLTIILLFLNFHLSGFAQSTSYAGIYKVNYDTENAVFEYKVELNSDGTFIFHSYSNHFNATPSEQIVNGKGTWKAKKNIISFSTDELNDLDKTYTLNFSNSKARIDRKSPRNKTLEDIPDLMRIYESDISWVKGKKLTKIITHHNKVE